MRRSQIQSMRDAAQELDTACFAAMRGAQGLLDAASNLPEGSPQRAKVEALGLLLRGIARRLDGKPLDGEINAWHTSLEIRAVGFLAGIPLDPELPPQPPLFPVGTGPMGVLLWSATKPVDEAHRKQLANGQIAARAAEAAKNGGSNDPSSAPTMMHAPITPPAGGW